MIILHSPHDKDSRDFVEKYGKDNIILNYPECLDSYPNISAFPSVVIDVPAYHRPSEIIFMKDENGDDIYDNEGSPISFTHEAENIDSYVEIYRSIEDPCDPDKFWNDIQDYIKMINERAKNNPIK